MKIRHHIEDGQIYSEVISEEYTISSVQDALDIMAEVSFQGSQRIIINEKNIVPEFFDLSTRIAGEILQKFVNYGIQVAIVGDFSKYNSTSLKDFIKECNRGTQLFFVKDYNSAKLKLISLRNNHV